MDYNESLVEVLIPTYRPGKELSDLLERLQSQSVKPSVIRIINTDESKFGFDERELEQKYDNVVVRHIPAGSFDHGATRHAGICECRAPYVLCMTQDALPADEQVIESLLKAHQGNERVAVAYARQLPRPDANPIEVFTRKFNYPENSMVKGENEIKKMGIKAFMCSNVCAMYKKEVYDKLGGFIRHTIFNEDMIFAAGAIKTGLFVAYVAEAKVIHSHNYGGIEQFHRNFDLGVSQADHPEVFAGVPSESAGIAMVKKNAGYLMKIGKPWLIVPLVWISGCKYLGYRAGKNYKKLSKKKIMKYTMNPSYWNN